jgi:RNase adaptor protein for sRNA GlmZ degradation
MSKRKRDKEDDHPMTLEEKLEMEIERDRQSLERLVDEALENHDAEKVVAEVMSDELEDEFE